MKNDEQYYAQIVTFAIDFLRNIGCYLCVK